MVERITQRVLDEALCFDGRQLVLRLADEFRFTDEDRQHPDRRDHHVVGGDVLGALVLRQVGIVLEALGERNAEARFVRAAVRRRDGVAIGMQLRIATIPGDRPFHRTVTACLLGASREDFTGNGEIFAERRRQIVLQAAREVEDRLFRDVAIRRDDARIA